MVPTTWEPLFRHCTRKDNVVEQRRLDNLTELLLASEGVNEEPITSSQLTSIFQLQKNGSPVGAERLGYKRVVNAIALSRYLSRLSDRRKPQTPLPECPNEPERQQLREC